MIVSHVHNSTSLNVPTACSVKMVERASMARAAVLQATRARRAAPIYRNVTAILVRMEENARRRSLTCMSVIALLVSALGVIYQI